MATGGHVGVSNAPENLIAGHVGVSGVPKKLIKGWIGDENNVPKLFYTGVSHGEDVITSSGTWTVPTGVTKIDIFCVGGSGGNCFPSRYEGSSGSYDTQSGYGNDYDEWRDYYAWGGSGYTSTALQVLVTPGETLVVSTGGKGSDGSGKVIISGETTAKYDAGRGGTSSVNRGATVLCSAQGGYPAATPADASSSVPGSSDTTVTKGGNGGSGGRSAGLYFRKYNWQSDVFVSPSWARRVNGTNGSNGGNATASGEYENFYNGSTSSWSVSSSNLATGQGSTTRAFGEQGGTLYDNFGEGGTVIIRW